MRLKSAVPDIAFDRVNGILIPEALVSAAQAAEQFGQTEQASELYERVVETYGPSASRYDWISSVVRRAEKGLERISAENPR